MDLLLTILWVKPVACGKHHLVQMQILPTALFKRLVVQFCNTLHVHVKRSVNKIILPFKKKGIRHLLQGTAIIVVNYMIINVHFLVSDVVRIDIYTMQNIFSNNFFLCFAIFFITEG